MFRIILSRVLAPGVLVAAGLLAPGAPVSAHESRQVGDFDIVVGFIDEPVFTGQKSGLEFVVSRGEEPINGLEDTLEAEVTYQSQTRTLPLSTPFGEEGAYRSIFFPTAAGPYTFRIFGTMEGQPFDESFTSSPDGFDEVQEAQSGQFPTVLPPMGQVVTEAKRGADAAAMVPFSLALGGTGVVIGLVGLGLGLAARRRSA